MPDLIPLVQDVVHGSAPIAKVEEAIAEGAMVDAWNGEVSPLLSSIKAQHLELTALLLKARADPHLSDDNGVSPLHVAVFEGAGHMCQLLINARANANLKDRHGQTPIFFAPHRQICAQLLTARADINMFNSKGQSALHLAAYAGLNDIVRWLAINCREGMIDEQDKHGRTAAYCASRSKLKSTTRLLQEHGADVTIRPYHDPPGVKKSPRHLRPASATKVTDTSRSRLHPPSMKSPTYKVPAAVEEDTKMASDFSKAADSGGLMLAQQAETAEEPLAALKLRAHASLTQSLQNGDFERAMLQTEDGLNALKQRAHRTLQQALVTGQLDQALAKSLAQAPPQGLELDVLALKVRQCLEEASATGELAAALAVIEPFRASEEELRLKAVNALSQAAAAGTPQNYVAFLENLRSRAYIVLNQAACAGGLQMQEGLRLKAVTALAQAAACGTPQNYVASLEDLRSKAYSVLNQAACAGGLQMQEELLRLKAVNDLSQAAASGTPQNYVACLEDLRSRAYSALNQAACAGGLQRQSLRIKASDALAEAAANGELQCQMDSLEDLRRKAAKSVRSLDQASVPIVTEQEATHQKVPALSPRDFFDALRTEHFEQLEAVLPCISSQSPRPFFAALGCEHFEQLEGAEDFLPRQAAPQLAEQAAVPPHSIVKEVVLSPPATSHVMQILPPDAFGRIHGMFLEQQDSPPAPMQTLPAPELSSDVEAACSLTMPVMAGEKRLHVATHDGFIVGPDDPHGFIVGREIVIDQGTTREEICIIEAFGTIRVVHPVKFDHEAGSPIVMLKKQAADEAKSAAAEAALAKESAAKTAAEAKQKEIQAQEAARIAAEEEAAATARAARMAEVAEAAAREARAAIEKEVAAKEEANRALEMQAANAEVERKRQAAEAAAAVQQQRLAELSDVEAAVKAREEDARLLAMRAEEQQRAQKEAALQALARAEEAKQKAEEEEARRNGRLEQFQKEQEEKRKKAEEEAKLKAQEEEKKQKAKLEAQQKAEEEARKKAEEQQALEQKRKELAEEELKKAQRELEQTQKEQDEKRRKAEEAAKLKAQEEERQKAEEAKHKVEEEARQKAEKEEAQRKGQLEQYQREQEEKRRKSEEEAKLKADNDARQKEEAFLKSQLEEAQLKVKEAKQKAEEDDARRKSELEQYHKELEEKQKRAEDEARFKAQEAEKKKAEGEALRQAQEEARREAVTAFAELDCSAEEEAQRKVELEQRQRDEAQLKGELEQYQREQEEKRRKAEEEAKLKEQEAEKRKKAEEEEERKRQKAEAEKAKQKAEEEEAKRKAEEAEAKRKAEEEEARRKAEEAEARLKAEEEEARLKRELEQHQKELEEKRRKAEEQAKLKAQEEERQKAEQAQRKLEQEARQKVEEEEARKKGQLEQFQREQEEKRRKSEEEAKLKAQEEQKRREQEEAQKKADEEARLKEEARIKSQLEQHQKEQEEKRRKAEEEANAKRQEEEKRRAGEEAQRKAQEEARRKAQEEDARRQAELDEQYQKAQALRRSKTDMESKSKAQEEERRKSVQESQCKAMEEARQKFEEEEARHKGELERYQKEQNEKRQRSGGVVAMPESVAAPEPVSAASPADLPMVMAVEPMAQEAEELEEEISFECVGKIGATIDQKTGAITRVGENFLASCPKANPEDKLRVKEGWKVALVDGLPFTWQVMKDSVDSGRPYSIVLKKDVPYKILFLPVDLNGARVMEKVRDNVWGAFRPINSTGSGIAYRRSKDIQDRADQQLDYGSTVAVIEAKDGWLKCRVPLPKVGTIEAFLPKVINGVTVLVEESKNVWRAQKHPKASNKTSTGVAFRESKDIHDRIPGHQLNYNETILGSDLGDGWIRCTIELQPELTNVPSKNLTGTVSTLAAASAFLKKRTSTKLLESNGPPDGSNALNGRRPSQQEASGAVGLFLPKKLNGVQILFEDSKSIWRAKKDEKVCLKTSTGIAFRRNKDMNDRVFGEQLNYDDTIEGVDEGDGWIRCTLNRKSRPSDAAPKIIGTTAALAAASKFKRNLSGGVNSSSAKQFRAGASTAYLPMNVSGVRVLHDCGNNIWRAERASNALQAGVAFRKSKNLEDRVEGTDKKVRMLKYQDTVIGTDEGDGWLRCDMESAGANNSASSSSAPPPVPAKNSRTQEAPWQKGAAQEALKTVPASDMPKAVPAPRSSKGSPGYPEATSSGVAESERRRPPPTPSDVPIPKTQEDGCTMWKAKLQKKVSSDKYGFSFATRNELGHDPGSSEDGKAAADAAQAKTKAESAAEKSAQEKVGEQDFVVPTQANWQYIAALPHTMQVLVVKGIFEEGLLHHWNLEHPDAAVSVGDRIVEVNGKTKVDEMKAHLHDENCIEITVCRFPGIFNVDLVKTEAQPRLGFKFERPVGQTLKDSTMSTVVRVTEVTPGGLLDESNKKYATAGQPQFVVIAGMFIQAANTVEGDVDKIADELRGCTKVHLRVLRRHV